MSWYYAQGGRQVGPFDDDAFTTLVASGAIHNDTLVWRAGMDHWQQFHTLRPAASTIIAPGSAVYCAECGQPHAPGEMIASGNSLICARCQPVFAQKLRNGVALTGGACYGGFWIRSLAAIIDAVLLNVIGFAIYRILTAGSQTDLGRTLGLDGVFVLITIALAAAYEAWFIAEYGATPGKMICRLKVVTPAGDKVSFARALGRHFAKYLSAFTFYIGFIMAALDREKRSLHDRICDTRVVKT